MGASAGLNSDVPIATIGVAGSSVPVTGSVKSLGVTLDSKLTFDQHVRNVCQSSAYHIRALRHICKFIDENAAKSFAVALVSARIDHCNALPHGISEANIQKLQCLQNSLARAVTGSRKYDHITPTLMNLHWLPISARIEYKIALLAYRTITTKHAYYRPTCRR